MPTPARPAAAAKLIGMQQASVASALSTALADAAAVFVPGMIGVMLSVGIAVRLKKRE
jgi:2-methylcitrate dehydratase PrpD